MENDGSARLFSRGSTPGVVLDVQPAVQPMQQLPASTDKGSAMLETLFMGQIAQPVQKSHYEPNAPYGGSPSVPQNNNSGPASPKSIHTTASHPHSSPGPAPVSHSTDDRHMAQMNLLGQFASPSPPSGSGGYDAAQTFVQPGQQAPTPPSSSQRSTGQTSNEVQGQLLLEQLMAGTTLNPPPRSTYSGSNASPPYMTPNGSQHDEEMHLHHAHDMSYPAPPLPPSQLDQQPPSPRTTMFDFHSPFDALAATAKKRQQQQQQQQQQQLQLAESSPPPPVSHQISHSEDGSWTAVSAPSIFPLSAEVKRKSVDNLLEQLNRNQPPLSVPSSISSGSSISTNSSFSASASTIIPAAGPGPYDIPLSQTNLYNIPATFSNANISPTATANLVLGSQRPVSPPAPPRSPLMSQSHPYGQSQLQQQAKVFGSQFRAGATNSPTGSAASGAGPANVHDAGVAGKEIQASSSPTPRGGPMGSVSKRNKQKRFMSPTSQPQSIIVDVSQSLHEVQTVPDNVKTTPIALVKIENKFTAGTSIGATHWVAYAMTKGRVRIISRSSGERTLLQLPEFFPSGTQVVDMAVFGNRLAGVTSDGGLVVWELPPIITDDVPGEVLLCVVATPGSDPFRVVKWHRKKQDVFAVASEYQIFYLNIVQVMELYMGEPLVQENLHTCATVFNLSSPLIAFDFDVPHFAIATISEDSVLNMWNIRDKQPFWSFKILGEGKPSSIHFLDNAVVIGRKNGTIFQLLSVMGKSVLSTVKFVNGLDEDSDMYGHVAWDTRMQTLWITNNRRSSIIAFKVYIELDSTSGSEEVIRGGYFEQVTEFWGPNPTIHFVILTADMDPTGDEAHAACAAAKVTPGDLALVAFSVHGTGVDQVLIRKEWFDAGLAATAAKFPYYNYQETPRAQLYDPKPPQPSVQPQPQPQPQLQHQVSNSAPANVSAPTPQRPFVAPPPASEPVLQVPAADEGEGEQQRDEPRHEGKGKRAKNTAAKKEAAAAAAAAVAAAAALEDSMKDKAEKGKIADTSSVNFDLGSTITKEIRKSEENLHTRLARFITKELDKQQHRHEELRAQDHGADLGRQETILQLISHELSTNTTRLVEQAIKHEMDHSVLPTLENIARSEIKKALDNQIAKGVADAMKLNLPNEMEKLFTRPDTSNQIARNFTSAITPLIDRNVKDAISKTLIPAFTQQTSEMHRELSRELRDQVLDLRKDILTWQGDALRKSENLIRDMDQSVRFLQEQMKLLTGAFSSGPSPMGPPLGLNQRSSPAPSVISQHPPPQSHNHYRQISAPMQPTQPPIYNNLVQPQPSALPAQWFTASQAPHQQQPAMMKPPPLMHPQQPVDSQGEDWDKMYLDVLHAQDIPQLMDLLARTNPDIVMPLNGPPLVSMAVVFGLCHRLLTPLSETSPLDENFQNLAWWILRCATVMIPSHPQLAPYLAKWVPTTLKTLQTIKQRLSLLPGGPHALDANRQISDIQDVINRKFVNFGH